MSENTVSAVHPNRKHGHASIRRGVSPTYRSWSSMISRCLNQSDPSFDDYGGRGIRVYDQWLDFQVFLECVGNRPSPKHTLDRFPDTNGNYEPGNVRWATPLEQQRNRRNNTVLTFQDESLCISAWAERTGIKATTIYKRIFVRGWTIENALTRSTVRPAGTSERTARRRRAEEHAKAQGISLGPMRSR